MQPLRESWWCRLVHQFLFVSWERTAVQNPSCGFFSAYVVTTSHCRWCGRCYTSERDAAHYP